MNNTNYQRRSPEQWKSIIDDFTNNDLSGPQYCQQHNIKYASFCKWRQRFLSRTSNEEKPNEAGFMDLSTLINTDSDRSSWHITLKLGHGVELVLKQS